MRGPCFMLHTSFSYNECHCFLTHHHSLLTLLFNFLLLFCSYLLIFYSTFIHPFFYPNLPSFLLFSLTQCKHAHTLSLQTASWPSPSTIFCLFNLNSSSLLSIQFKFHAFCKILHYLANMGVCLSAQIKAESPYSTGFNSKYVSTDGNYLGSTNDKVSGNSVPLTPRSEGEILQSSNLKSFTFSELKTATRNFRPDSVLGEGGFGSVFKGWIDENSLTATKPGTGIVIAVKRLNQDGIQGHREWLAEVNYLGQFSHPHLVRLIGFCLEDEHRLLVYEFMPRGSLENHLFRRGSYFQPLSWSLRLKVALDAARGLAFLHSAETKVIYRDFKTSNILLDSNYNAKLSDFGLAKDGPTGDKSHVSTRVMGTYGYAAPEYLATGHLTAKSDVYSFGVVLLEMLSGKRAVDKNRPSGQHNLVEWGKPYLGNKRKIFRVLDTRLEGQHSTDDAYKVANLALRCLSIDSKFRPNMDQVVTTLEQLQVPNANGGTQNHSRVRRRSADVSRGYQNPSFNGSRVRRRSADDISRMETPSAYPRPSASPLYT